MSKIAVFGGNGFAGSAIAKEAASRGHEVTVVARSAQSGTDTNVVQGSVHDNTIVEQITADNDVVVVAIPAREIDGKRLLDAVTPLADAAARNGARIAVVGGAGSLLVAEGGPRVVDTPDFPDAYKGEALAHADVLDALRATDSNVDWFYVSPAAAFGAHAGVAPKGSFQLGGDILLTDAEGNSAIAGEDYAHAFVDEIETPAHRRQRFTVAH
ncbi:NAD(P)-dependent oxidoreductase [Rhodococcus erythropolis]|jgi:putative NADH-flavin reductase|uniref:NAD(P)-binding domain-containing protein n=2 Tax=Rhodococcus erythropolis TaxID=1833 RepID=C0ZSH2_RHOE4|nr:MULTISPECIES: NAD(P)H-binding protein [Rhodococcus]ALU68782.1 NAD-dependent epimerase [Rhodococcus erythropolis R138]MBH5142707.1 NAD(P)H-binding protein [Rhodococcus erythropolis]MCS4253827.1 putative NADH-flavin reductase [Rhodococcus erythropolis]MCW2297740.1 putative NADH-flavin reductase [Rhodococcus erythropolis]MCW2427134.1 putative NADH-flavin reductase [Rhodococcus erythropolis]